MTIQSSQAIGNGAGAWFRAAGAVTGVGSVPHVDTARAIEFVARVAPEVPFWPQLRRMSPREAMLPQTFGPSLRHLVPVRGEYEYAVPGDRMDRFVASLEREGGRLDPANAAGFHAFVAAFRAGVFPGARAVKGQVMGPVTLCSALTVDGRPLIEREDLRPVIADHVVRMARWQAETLQSLSPAVLVVLDEAYLGMALRRCPERAEAIAGMLRSVVLRIRKPGVLVGIHCCDEIPFSILDAVAPDLYSFDAHHGAEALAEDPSAQRYLASGGRVAWGWIPTRDDLSCVCAAAIVDRWWDVARRVAALAEGVDAGRVVSSSLVTASCGLAGSSEETSARSFELAADVARGFAQRCGPP